MKNLVLICGILGIASAALGANLGLAAPASSMPAATLGAAAPIPAASAPASAPGSLDPASAPKLRSLAILIGYAGADKAPSRIDRTKAAARERAEQVSRLARQPGQDFGELAKRYSDGASAKEGGVVPPFSPQDVAPPVAKAVQALKPGQVSDPVETAFGYFIFQRLAEPKAAAKGKGNPDDLRLRGILISYSGARGAFPGVRRSYVEAKELAVQVREKAAKPGADFGQLAEQYSEDPTAVQGGAMGKLPPQAKEIGSGRLLFELEPGDVSSVIESPYGFYIFRREK